MPLPLKICNGMMKCREYVTFPEFHFYMASWTPL